MRAVLGIVVGIVAAFVSTFAIAWIGGMLFPSAATIDASSAESIAAVFPSLPTGAKAAILLSWFGGGLIGAYAAKKIVGRAWAAWTVAGVTAVFVLLNILVLPMPGWLQAVAVALPLIGGLLANHLVADAGPDVPA
jgi:hypothetical protein